jgi:hypothetical protein
LINSGEDVRSVLPRMRKSYDLNEDILTRDQRDVQPDVASSNEAATPDPVAAPRASGHDNEPFIPTVTYFNDEFATEKREERVTLQELARPPRPIGRKHCRG